LQKNKSLTKIFSIICLIFLFGINKETKGQLITEPFNYTAHVTDGLAKQSANVWNALNTGDSILIASGNLSYSGLSTSTGNKVTYGGAGTDYWRSFTNQTTGTVYCSFLLNITSLGSINTTGGYTVGFFDGTTTTTIGSTVWIRLSGTSNFNIGLNARTSAANTVWLPNTLNINTTYLIVMSYQYVTGTTNDVMKLWLNPASSSFGSTEGTSDGTATNTASADLTSIQRVFLRQDATTATPGALEIDELRVGTSWASVTAASASSPTITGVATASAFTTTYGTVSTAQTFSISGSNLTDSLKAIAPYGFELSKDSSNYYDSISIAQSSGTASGRRTCCKRRPSSSTSSSKS
jgi:hypothetical protein